MANTLLFNFGGCIDFDLVYRDANGAPEDISGDTFTVSESFPASIKEAGELVKTEPAAGKLHFHLPAEIAGQLGLGNVNRLRILRTSADGHAEASERIEISLR